VFVPAITLANLIIPGLVEVANVQFGARSPETIVCILLFEGEVSAISCKVRSKTSEPAAEHVIGPVE
jgi:hypothetical protein